MYGICFSILSRPMIGKALKEYTETLAIFSMFERSKLKDICQQGMMVNKGEI